MAVSTQHNYGTEEVASTNGPFGCAHYDSTRLRGAPLKSMHKWNDKLLTN